MSHRAWYAVAIGVALVVIGLLALRFPVYLDDFNHWGWQIKCGTGFSGDLGPARAASNGTTFVGDCETALLVRRLWAIPMVVVGALVFFGVLLASALVSAREMLSAEVEDLEHHRAS